MLARKSNVKIWRLILRFLISQAQLLFVINRYRLAVLGVEIIFKGLIAVISGFEHQYYNWQILKSKKMV